MIAVIEQEGMAALASRQLQSSVARSTLERQAPLAETVRRMMASAPPEGVRWGFRHIGLQAEGIEWELTLAGTAGPVRVVVADQSPGVPAPGGGELRLPAGTMFSRSWVSGTTIARSAYSF